MDQLTPAPAAPSAPAAPAQPSAPPQAPNTLAEFRAERAKSISALAEPTPDQPPAPPKPVDPPVPQNAEPVESPDEGDDVPQVQPDQAAQGPQPAAHRWKDPDTGVTLDMRRRDHRRIRRLLEERADYARRIEALSQQQARPQQEPAQAAPQAPPQATTADPNDPEPKLADFPLEKFADHEDPYLARQDAYLAQRSAWYFRQQQASHSRVERMRQVTAALSRAQQEYDSGLPQARERYQDFDDAHAEVLDTLGRAPVQVRTPLVHRLLTSPLRHDLTHYLGSHPDDLAAVISARSAHEQGLVLGAIETRVKALVNQRNKPAHPSPTPPPPAPMAPVGGQASPAAMPDAKSMNLAQFRAAKSKLGMTA